MIRLLPIGSRSTSLVSAVNVSLFHHHLNRSFLQGFVMKNYSTYFDYEYDLGRDVVSGSLSDFDIAIQGKSILDIGCGEGGVLAGLNEKNSFNGLGIDYDEEMIRKSRPVDNVEFKCVNFLETDITGSYDIILLRDVLEHCGNPQQFLGKVSEHLHESSYVYVTYTPFYSPFGGHQHNGSGVFSNFPYLQVLPRGLFNSLISPQGNMYKEKEDLIKDFNEIRETCLTTNSVLKHCEQFGMKVHASRAFIIRPDYKYKFGLQPVKLPAFLPLSSVTDVFCTSVEMILTKA